MHAERRTACLAGAAAHLPAFPTLSPCQSRRARRGSQRALPRTNRHPRLVVHANVCTAPQKWFPLHGLMLTGMQWSSMPVGDLKRACKARGLSTKGLKDELVNRLREWEAGAAELPASTEPLVAADAAATVAAAADEPLPAAVINAQLEAAQQTYAAMPRMEVWPCCTWPCHHCCRRCCFSRLCRVHKRIPRLHCLANACLNMTCGI